MRAAKMPSHERILEMRSDAFAEDVAVEDEMQNWSEEQIAAYFESGGTERRWRRS